MGPPVQIGCLVFGPLCLVNVSVIDLASKVLGLMKKTTLSLLSALIPKWHAPISEYNQQG